MKCPYCKKSKGILPISCELGLIDILNWWYDSKLYLKYTDSAINYASIKNKINVLDWLFYKIKDKRLEFKYSQVSFYKCKLEEKDMLELLKWWKEHQKEDTQRVSKKIRSKYGKQTAKQTADKLILDAKKVHSVSRFHIKWFHDLAVKIFNDLAKKEKSNQN